MSDLAEADQPGLARAMGGFIEHGAGGDGYSDCWLAAITVWSSPPPA